jgi:hypothetical protein
MFYFPSKMRLRKFGSSVFSFNKEVFPEAIIPPEAFCKSALVNYFFFLERASKKEILPISWQQGFGKSWAINRKIIPYSSERNILGYSYSNREFNLPSIIKKEEKILSTLLRKIKNIFLLRAPRVEDYTELIMRVIKK